MAGTTDLLQTATPGVVIYIPANNVLNLCIGMTL